MTHLLSLTAGGGRFCSSSTDNLRAHSYHELLSLYEMYSDATTLPLHLDLHHDLTKGPQVVTIPDSCALSITSRLVTLDLFKIIWSSDSSSAPLSKQQHETTSDLNQQDQPPPPFPLLPLPPTTPGATKMLTTTQQQYFHLLHYNWTNPKMGRKAKKKVCSQCLLDLDDVDDVDSPSPPPRALRLTGPRSSFLSDDDKTQFIDFYAILTDGPRSNETWLAREMDSSPNGGTMKFIFFLLLIYAATLSHSFHLLFFHVSYILPHTHTHDRNASFVVTPV